MVEPSVTATTDLGESQRRGFSLFYYNLKNRKICYVRDLYPGMIALDLICLAILFLFYQYFGEASSSSNVLAVSCCVI